MKSKITQTIIAGMIATAAMTVVIFLAPMMGLPKMNPAALLSGMMGVSIFIGYLMHLMIGIVFAATYVYWYNSKAHINNKVVKGILFGFVVFIFAQVMMLVMGKMFQMPMVEASMMLLMLGSLIGHLMYGIVVAAIVPNMATAQSDAKIKTSNA